MTGTQDTWTRRVDGRPETAADTRFFDLRESGYDGPVDQDGYKVASGRDNGAAVERAAFIPDLGELASRIDVVLDHPWIDRGVFLRDTLRGLEQAVEVLPSGPGRHELAALMVVIGRVAADPRADREGCLRETRDVLGSLAESTAADLRAAADRAAWVAGLRELADFLAAHPDVPAPPAYHQQGIVVFPEGVADAERCAGVDRVAGAMGVSAAETHGGHYKASLRFGPVAYEVIAIPKDKAEVSEVAA